MNRNNRNCILICGVGRGQCNICEDIHFIFICYVILFEYNSGALSTPCTLIKGILKNILHLILPFIHHSLSWAALFTERNYIFVILIIISTFSSNPIQNYYHLFYSRLKIITHYQSCCCQIPENPKDIRIILRERLRDRVPNVAIRKRIKTIDIQNYKYEVKVVRPRSSPWW